MRPNTHALAGHEHHSRGRRWGALNGPNFRIAKLAGFTLDNGAAIVETESAAQADVVASLPTSADTADGAKDYDAAADGDPIAWLARQDDAKDSSAWRLFAQRMAETGTVTQATVTTGTTTESPDGAITQVVFERLDPGLYLLADANMAMEGTTRSTPILVGTAVTGVTPPLGNADGTVEIKNQKLTIDKTIVDGEATHPTADKSVGDAVAYRIEAGIPDTGRYANDTVSPYAFRILDTLSKGQRFNNDLTVESTADGATVRFEKVASVGDALVKPSDDGSTLVVSNVQNLTQLPLTGSGGIVLFVAVGGLLAAVGVAFAMVTRRKAGALRR